jgi:structural hemagglutinin/hemolysin toxin protein RtxA
MNRILLILAFFVLTGCGQQSLDSKTNKHSQTNSMYLINFYVPETHLESVKSAMFKAGAGTIGNYSNCTWQVAGQGQFMPMEGSDPYLGKTRQLEQVKEYKVEMICAKDKLDAAIAALKKSHPYETLPYYIIATDMWLTREGK